MSGELPRPMRPDLRRMSGDLPRPMRPDLRRMSGDLPRPMRPDLRRMSGDLPRPTPPDLRSPRQPPMAGLAMASAPGPTPDTTYSTPAPDALTGHEPH